MLASLASLNDVLNFIMFLRYFFRFLYDNFIYIVFWVLVIFMVLIALLLDPEENIELFFDLFNQASRISLVHEDGENCDKNQSQLNRDENVKEPYKFSTQLNMDENVDKSSTTSDHINTDENVGEPLTNSSHISSTPSSPSSSNSSSPITDEDYDSDAISESPITDEDYDSDAISESISLDTHFSISSAQSSPPPELLEAEVEQGMNQDENNGNNVSNSNIEEQISNILSSDSNVNNVVVGNPEPIVEEYTTTISELRNQSARLNQLDTIPAEPENEGSVSENEADKGELNQANNNNKVSKSNSNTNLKNKK